MPRPFPISPVLTGISIGYRNDAQTLIADQVMPRIPVMAEQYKWTEYPVSESFTFPDTLVGRRGRVNRVEFSGTERAGNTYDYGLEDGIPYSDITAAAAQRARGLGNFDPENRAAEGLTDLVLLDREVRVAAKVQDPTNYAASRVRVLSGSSQFTDYQNSAPIDAVKLACRSTFIYRPNTVVMGRDTWTVLSSHPHLVNAIRGNLTTMGIITPAEFVNLFAGEGIKRLLIGEAFVNTARQGQAMTLNRVWGNSIEFLYIDPNVRPEQGGVSWGFTAQYGTRIAGSWDDKNVGLDGGKIVRVGEKVNEQVVAKDVGYMIQNAVPVSA